MDVHASYFDAELATLPSYRERVRFYGTHIALGAIRLELFIGGGAIVKRRSSATFDASSVEDERQRIGLGRRSLAENAREVTTQRWEDALLGDDDGGTTMAAIELTAKDEPRVEEFAGKLFMACLAAMELANVELGVRLGLYETLAGAGPLTASDLAAGAGIAERYAQEWLEQQTVAGVLEVDDASKPARERGFTLPNAHAHVLMDDDSEACMKPCAAVVPWLSKAIDIMVEEFRHGTGASFGLFDLHDIQAAFTRPVFVNHLTQTWLPALVDVQTKLSAGERVRIAEIGCGEGLAAITIARAYPNAEIDGFDLDEASIAAARKLAGDAGVSDRARFEVRDAGDPMIAGGYDLVMAIEMLHDVPDPVAILRTMRHLASDDGTVLVVDERTEDAFSLPASEMERFFYTFSTLHCLAVSMQNGGAGTGTVIRADTVRRYASEAGFATVKVLDVYHPQFVLYLLA